VDGRLRRVTYAGTVSNLSIDDRDRFFILAKETEAGGRSGGNRFDTVMRHRAWGVEVRGVVVDGGCLFNS
jgi:hypothetical protein